MTRLINPPWNIFKARLFHSIKAHELWIFSVFCATCLNPVYWILNDWIDLRFCWNPSNTLISIKSAINKAGIEDNSICIVFQCRFSCNFESTAIFQFLNIMLWLFSYSHFSHYSQFSRIVRISQISSFKCMLVDFLSFNLKYSKSLEYFRFFECSKRFSGGMFASFCGWRRWSVTWNLWKVKHNINAAENSRKFPSL